MKQPTKWGVLLILLAAGCPSPTPSGAGKSEAGADGAPGDGGMAGTGGMSGAGGSGAAGAADAGPAGGRGGGGGGGAVVDAAAADFGVSSDVGKSCGEQTTPIMFNPKVPDVLIAFDKSSSMHVNKIGMRSRYEVERDLLVPLVSQYEDLIRWGYEEFPKDTSTEGCPDGPFCCGTPVIVPPDFLNAMKVNAQINISKIGIRAGTPTASGLEICRKFYDGFVDNVSERYVLLSTDGEPTCGTGDECNAPEAQVKMLAAGGVKTVVLGVSEEVQHSDCLNRLALAGGVPRPGGPPHFYPGTNAADLEKYLKEIVAGLAKPPCTIDLASLPPDAQKVAVYFDDKQIPWDPGNSDGWNYDPPGSFNRIRIYGAHCTNLQTFKVKKIDVIYGCPPCGGTVSC